MFDIFEAESEKLNFYQATLEKDKFNQNRFSYWYEKIDNSKIISAGLKMPKSLFLKMPKDIFGIVYKDGELSYDEKQLVTDWITPLMASFGGGAFFLKNSLFSNKFEFWNCMITHPCQLADNLHSICYASMCAGAEPTTEIVLREPLAITSQLHIYEGMPLTTEYRLWVDFDNKQILETTDYWHESIIDKMFNEQDKMVLSLFHSRRNKQEYEDKLNNLKEKLSKALNLNTFDLEGIWSVDFMIDFFGQEQLIDMALARNSWGTHLLSAETKSKIYQEG